MSILTLFGQETTPHYDSSYDSAYASSEAASQALTNMSAITVLIMVVALVIAYVIVSFIMSRIFMKVGVESWKAWVPVYSNWILLELGGQKGFWAIITLIPIVGIIGGIFMLIAMYHIGLKFGKSDVFVLLAIFLPLIWMGILAFDKSTWRGTPSTPITPQNPGTPTAHVA